MHFLVETVIITIVDCQDQGNSSTVIVECHGR